MDDKPMDISEKTDFSRTKSQLHASEEQQESMGENVQLFPSESCPSRGVVFSQPIENIQREDEQDKMRSAHLHQLNEGNETLEPRDVIPGSHDTAKRKMNEESATISGAKKLKNVHYTSKRNIEDISRTTVDPDYGDRVSTERMFPTPSTSTVECSNEESATKSKAKILDPLHSDPNRKIGDITKTIVIPDSGEIVSTERISPRPSTSSVESSSLYSLLIQGPSTNFNKEPFICKHCSKGFKERSELITHNISHTDEEPPCLLKTVETHEADLLHPLEKNEESVEKESMKSACNESATAERMSPRPSTSAGASCSYNQISCVCEYCHKRYLYPSAYDIHVGTRLGEKLYECTYCDSRFAAKCILNIHTRTHTKEPFECKECNNKFATSYSLKRHFRSHTGEKKYKCPDCFKAFARKDLMLKHHKKIHKKSKES